VNVLTESHAFPGFQGKEIEEVYWLTRFCQNRGSWYPFTIDYLQSFVGAHTPSPHPAFGHVARASLDALRQSGVVTGPFFGDIRIPGSTWKEIEHDAILRSLAATGNSSLRAAQMLGMSVRKVQHLRREWQKDPPRTYFLTYEFLQRLGVPMEFGEVQTDQASRFKPGRPILEIKKDAIQKTLKEVDGSTKKAAKILDISARTIQYRLREWNMESRDFRSRQYLTAQDL
jgi:hypothetical protein